MEIKPNIEIRYVLKEIQIDRYILKKYPELFRRNIHREITPINICVNYYCLTHTRIIKIHDGSCAEKNHD